MEKSSKTTTPQWNQALEIYKEELDCSRDYQDIQNVDSLEDLIAHINTIQNTTSRLRITRDRQALPFLGRLGRRFKFIDGFSETIALASGKDAALKASLMAAVWGSIHMVIISASPTPDTLRDVLDMIEELSLTLPLFRAYEDTLPIGSRLELALIDVYTEVICFLAKAIHFFRDNPHALLRRNMWDKFQGEFSRTLLRTRRFSTTVDNEAEIARRKSDDNKYEGKFEEIVEKMDHLATTINTTNTTITTTVAAAVAKPEVEPQPTKYHHIPLPQNSKFSGRSELLATLSSKLDPDTESSANKTVALFGMGGVGKTQVALEYAHQSISKFGVVIWIAADSTATIESSFRDVVQELRLYKSQDEEYDGAAAILKVKNWLKNTTVSCLLIFDNVSDLAALKAAWPESPSTSTLLTTRDFDIANSPATQYLQISPFDETEGSAMLLAQLGLNNNPSEADIEHAVKITQLFGGLPLALSQAGGFIAQRRLPLGDFAALYERHRAQIDGAKTVQDGYAHTLSDVWDASFEKLEGENAGKLLNLLAFLDPEAIDEDIFLEGSQGEVGNDAEFGFLRDTMALNDAEAPLLNSALISKSTEAPVVLSLHQLIQAATIQKLSVPDRQKYLDLVIQLLSWGVPHTWGGANGTSGKGTTTPTTAAAIAAAAAATGSNSSGGLQKNSWKTAEKCMKHIMHIFAVTDKYGFTPGDVQRFAEMQLRYSWYLYEQKDYKNAKFLVDSAKQTFGDKAFAPAANLASLIDKKSAGG